MSNSTNSQKSITEIVDEKFTCEHEEVEIRKRPRSNQYVKQCTTCGKTGQAIPHTSLANNTLIEARMVDHLLRQQWWEAKSDYQQSLAEMRRKKEHGDFLTEHSMYLRSPEWQAKRTAVFRRDGYQCRSCEQAPAQQVHHLTYVRWGHEPLFDLVSVCVPCHEKLSAMSRSKKAIRPDQEW